MTTKLIVLFAIWVLFELKDHVLGEILEWVVDNHGESYGFIFDIVLKQALKEEELPSLIESSTNTIFNHVTIPKSQSTQHLFSFGSHFTL